MRQQFLRTKPDHRPTLFFVCFALILGAHSLFLDCIVSLFTSIQKPIFFNISYHIESLDACIEY